MCKLEMDEEMAFYFYFFDFGRCLGDANAGGGLPR